MATSIDSAVSSIVNQASGNTQQGVVVLRKALDAQAQTAAQLIQSIPQPPSASNLPPNLGRNINTTA